MNLLTKKSEAMLLIKTPAKPFENASVSEHMLAPNTTTIIGSCIICDIRLRRKSIDDVHLILKYDKDRKEVLVRDNKSDDGTYFADRGEALNNKTFYKFSLESTPSIKLKAGSVDLEIKDVAKHFYPS